MRAALARTHALVVLGLRLARAGGRMRVLAIVFGNALAVALLLGALGLQNAVYPPGATQDTAMRTQMVAVTAFILLPVAVLLLTVGRLSSATRDRRLASLRMLGLTPGRTRTVAAVENGCLAAVGSLAGLGLFAVLAPLVDRAVAHGPGWFAAPLRVPGPTAVLAAAAVVGLSVLVSAAPTRTLQADPRAARAEATHRSPSPWRLAVLAVAGGALLWLGEQQRGSAPDWLQITALLGGGLASAVAIAAVVPLLAAQLARVLTRARWPRRCSPAAPSRPSRQAPRGSPQVSALRRCSSS